MRRQVLLIAAEAQLEQLRQVFAQPALAGWRVDGVDSLEQAAFVHQTQKYDVLLLDDSLEHQERFDLLRWVARGKRVPLLVLSELDPLRIERAFRLGASHWLPRSLVLGHPTLFDAALQQAALLWQRLADLPPRLEECQDRVRRLLELLWEAGPGNESGTWFTQRHMMLRLEEEVARVQRTGSALTVVLGEVRPEITLPLEGEQRITAHTAERVGSHKRRCDVAGRYGLQGFMLLLPQSVREQGVGCCERLRPLLEAAPGGPLPPLHAAFGVASAFSPSTSVKELLGQAEEFLDQAREQGGGVVSEP